jgi:hypothetical protein
MKLPVIKASRRVPYRWELFDYLDKHNFTFDDLIGFVLPVSYRQGKKKRLKSIRILGMTVNPCECCGSHMYLSYSFGGEEHSVEY